MSIKAKNRNDPDGSPELPDAHGANCGPTVAPCPSTIGLFFLVSEPSEGSKFTYQTSPLFIGTIPTTVFAYSSAAALA